MSGGGRRRLETRIPQIVASFNLASREPRCTCLGCTIRLRQVVGRGNGEADARGLASEIMASHSHRARRLGHDAFVCWAVEIDSRGGVHLHLIATVPRSGAKAARDGIKAVIGPVKRRAIVWNGSYGIIEDGAHPVASDWLGYVLKSIMPPGEVIAGVRGFEQDGAVSGRRFGCTQARKATTPPSASTIRPLRKPRTRRKSRAEAPPSKEFFDAWRKERAKLWQARRDARDLSSAMQTTEAAPTSRAEAARTELPFGQTTVTSWHVHPRVITRCDPAASTEGADTMPSTTTPKRLAKARHRLAHLRVDEVSIVKNPANPRALIRLLKSAGADTVVVDLTTADSAQRRITGWASIATADGEVVVDSQGDEVDTATLHQAASAFLHAGGRGGVEHGADHGVIRWDQSAVLDAATCKALGITSSVEGWMVSGVVQDDDAWAAIRRGDTLGLSVGGAGIRVAKGSQPARRSGALTFSEALARTAAPSHTAVAAVIAKARRTAPSPRKAAAPAQRQAVPPKATTPPAPKPSTVALDAARRAIAQASPKQRETVRVMATVAAPRTAPDFARNRMAELLAAEAAEREGGKAAPAGSRALHHGLAAVRRLTGRS